ncbi:class A beta-lactamase [Paucibacter sp. PLA-PC-4]|uniref:class A beta-lactamase n=1 Tax=Paucibacter sp. PLA-PC-4 TaxID=2993655 RepID=UPI002248DFF5|nr:class A beta-lactamase [Paucibacter sp. PLA-PC-4]MCX2861029.1 class A beta-lactamase [Paucibacter sp. PLA-PC-4]
MNNLSRRQVLLLTGASSLLLGGLPGAADAALTAHAPFAALENRAGGRLGVAVLDCTDGALIGHRASERFALCSTFKLPLAGVVMREADQGRLRLDRQLIYGPADMVPHAPVTSKHLAAGRMSIAALAEATQTTSDNVAANLLLRELGGPAGLTFRLRELGDSETRLDRYEPQMNVVDVVHAGELRDTSTPLAMARTTERLLNSDWLAPASRERLAQWMVATDTGLKRLRAGFPAGWKSGDKTGSFTGPGIADKLNDIAIAWPLGRSPLIVSAYYESPGQHDRMRDQDQAVLAEVGRLAAAWWQERQPR